MALPKALPKEPNDPMDLKALIRDVPDFPQPGILFRDLTPLLADPRGLRAVVDRLADRYRDRKLDKIVGIEARGFIFGAPLAMALGVGFVPARKPGKLPYRVIQEGYSLEYGTNMIVMHEDAVVKGEKVLIVDDLIATGGTLAAVCKLVTRLGGEVAEVAAVVELTFLEGRKLLGSTPVYSMIQY
jgi:adenine phosphoribosyltransferase